MRRRHGRKAWEGHRRLLLLLLLLRQRRRRLVLLSASQAGDKLHCVWRRRSTGAHIRPRHRCRSRWRRRSSARTTHAGGRWNLRRHLLRRARELGLPVAEESRAADVGRLQALIVVDANSEARVRIQPRAQLRVWRLKVRAGLPRQAARGRGASEGVDVKLLRQIMGEVALGVVPLRALLIKAQAAVHLCDDSLDSGHRVTQCGLNVRPACRHSSAQRLAVLPLLKGLQRARAISREHLPTRCRGVDQPRQQ